MIRKLEEPTEVQLLCDCCQALGGSGPTERAAREEARYMDFVTRTIAGITVDLCQMHAARYARFDDRGRFDGPRK